VNTHDEYRRHTQKPAASATPDAPTAEEVNQLARFRDPSLTSRNQAALVTPSGKRIAWVRPTELHSYAGSVIGRGIDLQAELARRAARAPRTAARSVRRATPPLTRRGPAASTAQEGLQL
jgi:hypothetical protein